MYRYKFAPSSIYLGVFHQPKEYIIISLVHIQLPEGSLYAEEGVMLLQRRPSLRFVRSEGGLLQQELPIVADLGYPVLDNVIDSSILAAILDREQTLRDLFVQRLNIGVDDQLQSKYHQLNSICT